MEKTIRAVIFDLDGVIINSNPEIEKFWHKWAAKTKRQLSQQNITEHIHGRKGVETLSALFSDINEQTKNAIAQDAVIFDSKMNPDAIKGIHQFTQALCNLNMPLGVVTSSHNSRAQLMLKKQNLDGCFTAFVTAEDVIKGKPDPQPYQAMAEKLNIPPSNCLVFEDAISGVQSAKAAGMEVIGINTEEASEKLLSCGAAFVVADFDELLIKKNTLQSNDEIYYVLKPF